VIARCHFDVVTGGARSLGTRRRRAEADQHRWCFSERRPSRVQTLLVGLDPAGVRFATSLAERTALECHGETHASGVASKWCLIFACAWCRELRRPPRDSQRHLPKKLGRGEQHGGRTTKYSPAGWTTEHLEQASPDLLQAMLGSFVEVLMSADADAVCNAGCGVRRTSGRTPAAIIRRRDWLPGPARSTWR
jgi:hypothetical protein